MGLFKSTLGAFKKGLALTRDTFVSGLRSILIGRRLSEDLIDEIEKRLLQADVGVRTTVKLIEKLRAEHKSGRITEGDQVLDFLKDELKSYWPESDRSIATAPNPKHLARTLPLIDFIGPPLIRTPTSRTDARSAYRATTAASRR